jgi:hypothetical protein
MSSFVVSGMTQYVAQNANEIAAAAVTKASTIKLLLSAGAVQFGKGEVALTTMSQDVHFSDGSTCGRVDDTPVTFSQRKIKFVPLFNGLPICAKDLYDTVLAEAISQGQNEETIGPEVFNKVVENRTEKISAAYDKLLWQGDTSITGSTNNMRFIDGYVKRVTAEGNTLTLSGSDVIAKLQSFASQVSEDVKDADDFRVFISKATYDAMKLALYNKNMFNPGAELVIPGTDVKIEVNQGLKGAGKAVGMRLSNMKAILDKEGDETYAAWIWDAINNKGYLDYRFGGGTQIVIPSETYIATI